MACCRLKCITPASFAVAIIMPIPDFPPKSCATAQLMERIAVGNSQFLFANAMSRWPFASI